MVAGSPCHSGTRPEVERSPPKWVQPHHSSGTERNTYRRERERHPEQFGKKQHSIVQRPLRALRKTAAQRLIAETAAEGCETVAQPPGAVDGSGCGGPHHYHYDPGIRATYKRAAAQSLSFDLSAMTWPVL